MPKLYTKPIEFFLTEGWPVQQQESKFYCIKSSAVNYLKGILRQANIGSDGGSRFF